MSLPGAGTKLPENAQVSATPPRVDPGAPRVADRVASAARVLSHLAIWAVILVPTVTELARGWRALQDDATISLRSYEVLSLHPPLLGQFSTASYWSGHTIFDPGPLLYWLLTIPVHLDPARGGLWGAALGCGLVLSVAFEAVWTSGHRLAGAVVAVAVVDLAWTLPEAFAHLIWNPYFGLMFLAASLAISFAVATGSFGWWPVLVFTASVTAQAELIFAILAVALVVISPMLGLVGGRSPARLRWLGVGAGVGAVCWVTPLIQQVAGSPGNLALILDAHGKQAGAGLSFGLRSLALAGSPAPIWLIHGNGLGNLDLFDRHSPGVGVVVFVVTAGIAVLAGLTGRRALAALAALGTVASVVVVYTFAEVPAAHQVNLVFLMYFLWVVGILLWTTAAWALVEVVNAARNRVDRAGMARWWTRRSDVGVVIGGTVFLGALLGIGAAGLGGLSAQARAQSNGYQIAQLGRIVAGVEKEVSAGPVAIELRPDLGSSTAFSRQFSYLTGAGWALSADGWQPALPALFTAATGVAYPPHSDSPTVVVTVVGTQVVSVERIR
jgi:hypothetical protein